MSNSVNELAVAAADSKTAREDFIRHQEQLILKTASRASFRYITKSDDEWSVALAAFSDAIDRYDLSRGDFLPFAQMLMKRALIDYHRSEASYLTEISTSPFVLEGIDDAEDESALNRSVYLAIADQSRVAADRSLQDEILAANENLQRYGFRFFDLTECSPQQEKTKQECAKAIRYVLSQPDLLHELEKSKKLPIRALARGSGVLKKTLDRYRKYIT
jgi:RNA polymerase sigma factor